MCSGLWPLLNPPLLKHTCKLQSLGLFKEDRDGKKAAEKKSNLEAVDYSGRIKTHINPQRNKAISLKQRDIIHVSLKNYRERALGN